ncbi:MAG TPA: lipoyl(octanoyl) transferase LipB [Fimbriimonadaceae bacterium]|nr:lipoyl(octanoyl) transferase LipB [Fimbriimonadaceae bacterium]
MPHVKIWTLNSKLDILEPGLVPYTEAVALQESVHKEVLEGSRPDTLILIEHPPVLTLGANFHESNLLMPVESYSAKGIEVVRTGRGGDVTFHGPNQLVIYPIFDLRKHGQDLHKYLRDLEEVIIHVLSKFELEGFRFPPHTGVWVDRALPRKIAAIGIQVKRWVSMHGIALNCNNDLSPFDLIVPCGIEGYDVTSVSKETGRDVSTEMAKPLVIEAIQKVFFAD